MPDLKSLVGETILAMVPMLDRVEFQELKLHGVEDGGLWVESQKLTNQFLQKIGSPAAPRTAVLFLPFHEIRLVLSSVDVPALGEKAFGV